MTFLEKLKIEHPECVDEHINYRGLRCPHNWGYARDYCCPIDITPFTCKMCWNRKIPEAEDEKARFEKKCEKLYAYCTKTKCDECPVADFVGIAEVCEFSKLPEEKLDKYLEAIHAAEKKPVLSEPTIKDSGNRREFECISELEEYTNAAMRYRHHGLAADLQLFHGALGLAGESGEVCDLIKKYAFQGHPLDKDKLVEELGDTLWYLTQIAYTIGVPLAEIMDKNIQKLFVRYPNGRFEVERSINREETE